MVTNTQIAELVKRAREAKTERKFRKFKVKEYELKVAAPEDLIANRLHSAKFWKSNPQLDLEQAVALLKIFSGSIDDAYLDDQAKKNDTADILTEARKYA